MAKRTEIRKEVKGKSDAELRDLVASTREELRKGRMGVTSEQKGVREKKRMIARALTELTARAAK